MTTTTVEIKAEASAGPSRYVYRSTVTGGDTLQITGLPTMRSINVKVFPAASTVSVYSSSDEEATIIAGTANKMLWPQGAVTADAEDTLSPGHTGIIIAAVSGTVDVEITA